MSATVDTEHIRAVLRLIEPDHITPMGARQIERILQDAEQTTTTDEGHKS